MSLGAPSPQERLGLIPPNDGHLLHLGNCAASCWKFDAASEATLRVAMDRPGRDSLKVGLNSQSHGCASFTLHSGRLQRELHHGLVGVCLPAGDLFTGTLADRACQEQQRILLCTLSTPCQVQASVSQASVTQASYGLVPWPSTTKNTEE